jgi:hypothetical protein
VHTISLIQTKALITMQINSSPVGSDVKQEQYVAHPTSSRWFWAWTRSRWRSRPLGKKNNACTSLLFCLTHTKEQQFCNVNSLPPTLSISKVTVPPLMGIVLYMLKEQRVPVLFALDNKHFSDLFFIWSPYIVLEWFKSILLLKFKKVTSRNINVLHCIHPIHPPPQNPNQIKSNNQINYMWYLI